MGADGYKIDLEQLDDAIAKMAAFGTDAAELHGEITRRVDGLHLSWSGAAQAAHQEVMALRESWPELPTEMVQMAWV